MIIYLLKFQLLLTFSFLFQLISTSQILQKQSIAVTIYNNNFGVVKDVRKIQFDQGQSLLYFTDVSANMQSETVTFKAINNPTSIRVYQQNFDKNIINRQAILKKYILKNITFYAQFGNSTKLISGKLLAYNSGLIIELPNGIQIFNKIAAVQFPSVPQDFFTVPTLNWKVMSNQPQTTSCQVAYRTTGFQWSADYSLTLNQDETAADLGGWVTIDNNSGKKYEDAKIKLIAGDVNIVPPQKTKTLLSKVIKSIKPMPMHAQPAFNQKSFADYHMYTLNLPVTLNQSSQKQVQFMPKVFSIPIQKYHQIKINAGGSAQDRLDVKNYVKFQNSNKNQLGIAFPKGTVRLFKQDSEDGSIQFIGEDSIKHTPKNQNITVQTGKAFDIVASKKASSWVSTNNKGGYRANLQLQVKNHKNIEAEIVIIFNNIYGDNLKMETQNQPQRVSALEFRWNKRLLAGEQWDIKWKEDYYN